MMMKQSLHVVRRALFCAVASASFVATGAGAQTAATDTTDDSGSDEKDIVVTGTRIPRPNLDSPNPVAVFDSTAIEKDGSPFLGDTLSRLPQFGSTATAAANANNATNSGTVNLDLRRLGTNRTLVLINGRRQVGGGGGSAAVDINTIPSSLVQRVEILTGGASAVYGADAVTGAVNFVLRDDFEGAKFNLQYGDSDEGSTGSLSVSALLGTNFDDNRGNIAVAIDYSKVSALLATERSFRRASVFDNGNPADPFFDNPDVPDFVFRAGTRDPLFSLNGVINNFAVDTFIGHVGTRTNVFQLSSNGDIIAFNPGSQLVDFGDTSYDGDGPLTGPLFGNAFLPGVTRVIGNIVGSYKISDNVTAFGEVKFAHIESDTTTSLDRRSFTLFNDNAYLSAQGRAFLASRNVTRATVNRWNVDIGRRRLEADRNTYRLVGGIRGDLSDHLKFETSVQYSKVNNSITTVNQVVPAKILAAADAVIDTAGLLGPAGRPVCRVALQRASGQVPRLPNNAVAPDYAVTGCVPLNIFGNGTPSAAARAFVTANHTDTNEQDQFVANLTFTGDLGSILTLPGGAPKFAFGAEYRRETAAAVPSGLASLGVFGTIPAALSGDYTVKEGYAEVVVPILAKVPFAEELSLNGAYRISDYSTIGTTHTWNAGGIWSPVAGLRFRASAAKAVRAPNLTELFSAQSVLSQFVADPCSAANIGGGSPTRRANCQALGIAATGLTGPFANFEVVTGGNPNLDPETSRSHSFGVVISPTFLPRLTFSADYWSYNIEGAISTASLSNIVTNCVDAPSLDPTTCGLIVRDPATRLISRISASQSNFQKLEASGLDFELGYTHPTSFGRLAANLSVTYTDHLKIFPFRAFPTISQEFVGTLRAPGIPEWQGALRLSADIGKFEIYYSARAFSTNFFDSPDGIATDPNRYSPAKTGFRSLHDINVEYEFDDNLSLYAGINNIFQSYPAFGNTGAGGSSSIFDNIGRFFYGGVRVKFGKN